MKRILSAILVLFILITSIGFGCGGVRGQTIGEQQLVDSSNTFGFELFKEVVAQEGDKNIFISPLSVSMALGMTLNGADGETYEAMKQTLELAGLSEEGINEAYQSLIALLRGLDQEVIFQIANSIWCRQGFPTKQSFLDVCQQYFDAEIAGLDFSDPFAIDTINGWVDENTNGKIEEIIDEIDPNTVMFLINAIYFKGTWKYEFDEQDTKDTPFYLPCDSEVQCQMMQQQADLDYYENDDFQAVDLPYGNGKYSMTVILPDEDKDIDSLIAELNDSNWNEWTGNLSEQKVVLYLPRFTLEYECKLNDALKTMGMEVAFDGEQADFSRMYHADQIDGNLWIDEVKHKTFVEVNEEGTEAAAVTSVSMSYTTSVQPDRPKVIIMRVDRPFIFAIRENYCGSILFAGKIINPTA